MAIHLGSRLYYFDSANEGASQKWDAHKQEAGKLLEFVQLTLRFGNKAV